MGEVAARLVWLLLAVTVGLAWPAFGRDEPRMREVPVAELPREARETLRLIRQGGPFPYRKDGTVFGNRERRLPIRSVGYYREYTVRTPGSKDRGARRIVAGSNAELYYTDDHYQSFRRVQE